MKPELIKEPLVIYQCMRTTLMEAIKHNVNSIVIPAFGGDCGGLNHDLIAKMMYQGFCQVFGEQPTEISWENHLSNRALYVDVNVNKEEYHFMKSPYFNIVVGNIVDDSILSKADAIVLPSNPMMRYGGGVSGAIFEKAGIDELETYGPVSRFSTK